MPRLHVRSCIATSLFLIAVAVAADSKPNLSGTWKMNGKKTVVREYVTDGRQMSQAVLDTDRKSSAHWDGGVLVIETNVNDGAYTIRDRWTLAEDKRSIRIDRQFSSPQGTRTQ